MKMYVKKTSASLALLAAAAGATAAGAETYTIGVIQSLTGPAAFIGSPVVDGIVMAIDEANASGALGDVTLSASVEDDAFDRAQVITLMNRFAADPNTIFVAGPTSGAVAGVGAEVANGVQLPIMTVSNARAVQDAGPWSYMTAQPAHIHIPELAAYVVNELGAQTCQAISINDNEAYVTQNDLFLAEVASLGATTLEAIGVRGNESDFSAASVRLVDEGADCIFVGAPAAMAANIIIQLRQAGLDPDTKLIGMTSFASPELIRIGGEAVEGVYFAADWVPGGNSELATGFAERFQERYGREAGNWEAIGFSTGLVFIHAIQEAGATPTREAIRAALEASTDVPVVVGNGAFSYDAERVPHYGVNILTVRDGAFAVPE